MGRLAWSLNERVCVCVWGEWGCEWILMDMLVLLLWEHKGGVFNARRFIQAEVLIARVLPCLCHIPSGLTAPSAHMRCHYF